MKEIKYLGVVLERGLNFDAHVKYVSEKASAKADAVGRLTPNIGGPLYYRRRVMSSVIQSIMVYAAPV